MGTICCLGQNVLPNPRYCVLNRVAPVYMPKSRPFSTRCKLRNECWFMEIRSLWAFWDYLDSCL